LNENKYSKDSIIKPSGEELILFEKALMTIFMFFMEKDE